MTKPAKPEFTTYEGAKEFLKGGRKKTERPTKDGWNTKVVIAGDGIDLEVHGTVTATFLTDGTVRIPQIVWDRTGQNRLARYIMEPRGLFMSGGNIYVQQRIAHTGNTFHDSIHRWDGKEPLILTDHGIKGIPYSLPDARIKELVTDFVARSVFYLTHGFMLSQSTCQMCVKRMGDGMMWGTWLGDPEHVFGHINNSYSPDGTFLHELVEVFLQPHPTKMGAFMVAPEHMDDARKHLEQRLLEEIYVARV